MKTHFSIIIPTFNRGKLVYQTITSILQQKNSSFEIIIVDDGGSDDTFQVIEEFNDARIKYIKTENKERGSARNSGLKISIGTYINYFDSDDILAECLPALEKFITKNNFPDVVYGVVENVSADGTSIEIVNPRYLVLKKSLLYNNFLACGSVFIKREVALRNLFSEDRRLSGTEDWELWLRMYSVHDFVRFPKVVLKQRQHSLRSLHKISIERVTERETAFIEHLENHQDLFVNKFSKAEINLFVADRYTLIALAQCESTSRNEGFNYLLKSLKRTPSVVRRKRFWAVLKKLFLD